MPACSLGLPGQTPRSSYGLSTTDDDSCSSNTTSFVTRRQHTTPLRYAPYYQGHACHGQDSHGALCGCKRHQLVGSRKVSSQPRHQAGPTVVTPLQQHPNQDSFQEAAIRLCEASVASTQQAMCAAILCCYTNCNPYAQDLALQQAEASMQCTLRRLRLTARYITVCMLKRQQQRAQLAAACMPKHVPLAPLNMNDSDEVSSTYKPAFHN